MFNWFYSSNKNKTKTWYIVAITIVLSLALWWLVQWIYAMTIVVLLLAWVYFLVENNSSDTIWILINDEWIFIWNQLYAYSQLESFSVIYSWSNPIILRLKLKWNNSNSVDIYLVEWINIGDLRTFLSRYINEDSEIELSFLEIILHLLKL